MRCLVAVTIVAVHVSVHALKEDPPRGRQLFLARYHLLSLSCTLRIRLKQSKRIIDTALLLCKTSAGCSTLQANGASTYNQQQNSLFLLCSASEGCVALRSSVLCSKPSVRESTITVSSSEEPFDHV